jgi:hypothetical protein
MKKVCNSKIVWFWIRTFVLQIFFHKTTTPMALEQEISQLAVAQVDFIDDTLESNVEETLTAYGELFRISLELDKVNETDNSVAPVAGGVLKLANQFGVVFKDLTSDQADAVKAAVAEIVTGPNEGLIETFFNASLNFITKAKGLNIAVDQLISTEE